MSIQEKRREAFEEWYLRDTGFDRQALARDKDGYYTNEDALSCWEGWNGALNSVVIELPEYTDEVRQYGYPAEDVVSSIESAGVRVKQ